jgi:hypothetical protein
MTYDTGFILDGLILVFLAVTIFYAARLSLFLKSFREGRNGMQILIRDLSTTIDKAEKSIQQMKGQVLESEQQLQDVVNEARYIADELRFMNDTGDKVADRLEKLAERTRDKNVTASSSAGNKQQKARTGKVDEPFEIEDFEIDEDDERDYWALSDGTYREEDHKSKVDLNAKNKVSSFAIFDRDFMDTEEDDPYCEQDNEDTHFKSRAEQDLYEALQRKKRVREIS